MGYCQAHRSEQEIQEVGMGRQRVAKARRGAVAVLAGVALALGAAPSAMAYTEWTVGRAWCDAGQQWILSSESVGYTYHYSTSATGNHKSWYKGWVDYPNPRRATWTGHLDASHKITNSGGPATLWYKHRYCAG